jgi:hypothetical protein
MVAKEEGTGRKKGPKPRLTDRGMAQLALRKWITS